MSHGKPLTVISTPEKSPLDVEQAVGQRYTTAAQETAPALCCPVEYDDHYLRALPAELIERDYGCGNPSRHLREGETVLDLGCGGGKICYIAAQVVGSHGRVIGVDMNDEMLALARRYQQQIGDSLGFHNTEFRRGRIQDLALDLDVLEQHLASDPVASAADWLRVASHADSLRQSDPMIASDSIDVIVSNCVLNLVSSEAREQLFNEMFRVLRRGGRAVISDIVSDEPVPESLRNDPQLWSGCISGAFQEHQFVDAFAAAGFYGMEILERDDKPWAIVDGIEFRSMTVCAYKGKQGPCLDQRQAVIYCGPWKSVTDDDGHVLRRGVRTAVCGKTYKLYSQAPYANGIIAVAPAEPVAEEDAEEYDCHRNAVRSPRETKGPQATATVLPGEDCCGGGDSCC